MYIFKHMDQKWITCLFFMLNFTTMRVNQINRGFFASARDLLNTCVLEVTTTT